MGASGVKLFDDDLACDVRDLFRELLECGNTGPQASAALKEEFAEVIGTPEEGVFWLALAEVQWEYGIPDLPTLKRALSILESGSDLVRWAAAPKLQAERKKVLVALAEQLKTPSIRPKRVRLKMRASSVCAWQQGDVLSYQLTTEQFLLLRVVAMQRRRLQELAICELLDWVGSELPSRETVLELPIRRNKRYPSESMFYFPLVKKHLARICSLGLQLPTTMHDDGSYVLSLKFDAIGRELEEYFGLVIGKN